MKITTRTKSLIIISLSLFIFLSCSVEDTGIGVSPRISECGGFEALNTVNQSIEAPKLSCNDTLSWYYNSENQIISFQNDHISLNCCGKRSINVQKSDSVYVITEIDYDGTCKCTCDFSYAIDIPDIKGESIDIKLRRDIDDNLEVIMETSINLTENYGEILIEEKTPNSCEQI